MNNFLLKQLKKIKAAPQIAIITGSGITLFRDKEPIFEVKYSELNASIKGIFIKSTINTYWFFPGGATYTKD